MAEQFQTLKNDLLALQKFWGTEAFERRDEVGIEFAKGASYGFKIAAAIIETKEPK
ncbi:hypothetical protein [Paenibacillus elgii]|uniref:hypothetical protein n=1 Tax=Paenibacillus elgii TaxID=189691 RepID=UPI000248C96E|nr:hypothetical protein [Paenibacillus elgii]